MSRKLEANSSRIGSRSLMRAAGISLCLTMPLSALRVEAKAPGVSHCYRNVCHKVRTIEQTRRLIGQPFSVETSYYDIPGVDRFNTGVFTSNGERFDADDSGRVASADLPDGTELLLRNPINGRVSHVRVNDFGPFRGNRRLDVTRRVAEDLDFRHKGVVRLDVIVIAAPQEEDLRYRRNRPRRPTAGHLGVIFDAEMPALVTRLAAAAHSGPEQVALANSSEFARLPPLVAADAASATQEAVAFDPSPQAEVEPAPLVAAVAVAREFDPPEIVGLMSAPQPVLDLQGSVASVEPAPAPATAPARAEASPSVVATPVDAHDTARAAPVRTASAIALAVDEPAYQPAMATFVAFPTGLAQTSGDKPSLPLLLVASALSALLAIGLALRQRPARQGAAAQTRPAARAPRTPSSNASLRLANETVERTAEVGDRAPAAVAGAPAAQLATSHLAAGLEIQGSLTCPGRLEVAGRITGRVEADEVIALPGGRIEGEVVARVLDIAGSVQGTLACDSLTVKRHGEVEGRIVTKLISVELGSRLEAEIIHAAGA